MDKIHFKVTHRGATRRIALSRGEGDLVSALKTRVLKITGTDDVSLFWKDEDSLIVLDGEHDMHAAIDYAQTVKLGCITLEIGENKMEKNKEVGKEDVKIVSAEESEAAFNGFAFNCDECNCFLAPSNGGRFKCTICDNYDLCVNCLAKNNHDNHPFVRLLNGETQIQILHELNRALVKDTPRCTPNFVVKSRNNELSDAEKIVNKVEEWNVGDRGSEKNLMDVHEFFKQEEKKRKYAEKKNRNKGNNKNEKKKIEEENENMKNSRSEMIKKHPSLKPYILDLSDTEFSYCSGQYSDQESNAAAVKAVLEAFDEHRAQSGNKSEEKVEGRREKSGKPSNFSAVTNRVLPLSSLHITPPVTSPSVQPTLSYPLAYTDDDGIPYIPTVPLLPSTQQPPFYSSGGLIFVDEGGQRRDFEQSDSSPYQQERRDNGMEKREDRHKERHGHRRGERVSTIGREDGSIGHRSAFRPPHSSDRRDESRRDEYESRREDYDEERRRDWGDYWRDTKRSDRREAESEYNRRDERNRGNGGDDGWERFEVERGQPREENRRDVERRFGDRRGYRENREEKRGDERIFGTNGRGGFGPRVLDGLFRENTGGSSNPRAVHDFHRQMATKERLEKGKETMKEKEDDYKMASQIPAHMVIGILTDDAKQMKSITELDFKLSDYIKHLQNNTYSLKPHSRIFANGDDVMLIGNIAVDLEKHLRSIRQMIRDWRASNNDQVFDNEDAVRFWYSGEECWEKVDERTQRLRDALKQNGTDEMEYQAIAWKLRPILLTSEYTSRGEPCGNWDDVFVGFMEADPLRDKVAPPRVPSTNPDREGLFAPTPKGCVVPPAASAAAAEEEEKKIETNETLLRELEKTELFSDQDKMIEACSKAADLREAIEMMLE